MLYLQICLIGLAILMIPLLNSLHSFGREQRLFRTTVIVAAADLLFETAGWLLDGAVFPGAHSLIYVICFFTILLQPVLGLLWLYYAFEKLRIQQMAHSKYQFLCAAPFFINLILLLINGTTGIIFSVGDGNLYVRGRLFFISILISFLYPLAASILALHCAKRATSRARRHDCYVLASFILPPIIAATIQVLWYGSFLFLIGFAISLLFVFINIQNEQITIDFLTRINNRASLISYFERRMRSRRPGEELYLFMIDVDAFKHINDTYGHSVGDQVLTAVADQLKRVCAGQKCFLARLGGDEFGILLEGSNSDGARAFAVRIDTCLNEFNADSNLSAPVTLSVGYAACEDEDCTIDKLMQQADIMMYTKKALHHMAAARQCP